MNTPKPLELQEMFDKIWVHAINPSTKKSKGRDGRCKYKTKEGDKCFMGIFIPSDEYKEELEDDTISFVLCRKDVEKTKVLFSKVRVMESNDPDYDSILEELQGVHDGFSKEEWPIVLGLLAKDYNLTIPGENNE